jgi:hypothetical protein
MAIAWRLTAFAPKAEGRRNRVNVANRRLAAVADRDRERRKYADSQPSECNYDPWRHYIDSKAPLLCVALSSLYDTSLWTRVAFRP